MNLHLPDLPEHVDKTEPFRQRYNNFVGTAFDEDDAELERTVRDVIDELEMILETKGDRSHINNKALINDQARRLLGV